MSQSLRTYHLQKYLIKKKCLIIMQEKKALVNEKEMVTITNYKI